MDTIANFITMLKNAGAAGKETVAVPASNINSAIAELLKKHGYIKSFSKKNKKTFKTLEIEVAYEGDKPKVKGAQRVSKLSRRVYEKAKDIKPFRHGYGMAVLSTPKGVMADKEAREAGVGGEILFKIW